MALYEKIYLYLMMLSLLHRIGYSASNGRIIPNDELVCVKKK